MSTLKADWSTKGYNSIRKIQETINLSKRIVYLSNAFRGSDSCMNLYSVLGAFLYYCGDN